MENKHMTNNQAITTSVIIIAAIGGTVLVMCGPLCALLVVIGALVVGRMQS
jgi:hypothetical protein